MSDTTVKLGLMPPLTGVVGLYGTEISRAAQIACQEVNAQGGVLGRPLELVIEDDGSLPDSAVAAAEKLIDHHRCVAFVGNLLSNSRIAVAYRVAEPRKIPYLNFSFYEGSILSRYFFHFAALPNQQIDRMIPYMRAKFGSRMFFAGNNYEWPRGSIDAAKRALLRAGGEVVGEEYCPIGVDAEGMERLLDMLESAAPDVFVPYFAGADQVNLLTRFTERGLKKRMAVVMGHYDEMMASTLSPQVREGFYSSNTYFMTVDTAENRHYLARLAQLPGVSGIWPEGNGILTNFGEGSYLCVKAFAQAANEAGSLDSEALVDVLQTVSVTGPQGVVRMDPATHHARVNTYLARCKADGVFALVDRFGAIDPRLPERYHHQRIGHQATLEGDIRLQARMLEQMSEAVFLVNARDATLVFVNVGAERMFGYANGELLGKPLLVLEASPAEAHHDTYARITRVLAQKGAWQGEISSARKDGATVWCSLSISTFTHPVFGEVWLCVASDISARKKAEQALQSERDFAASLLNAAPVIVILLDLWGTIQYVNPHFEQLAGYPLEEIRGRHWFTAFLAPRDQERTRALFRAVNHEAPVRSGTSAIVIRSGEEREIEWRYQARRDVDGAIVGILSVGQDVTERTRSEQRLSHTQAIAHVGSWELDIAADVLSWSDETYRIFGRHLQRHSSNYATFMDAVHPDDRAAVDQAYRASVAEKVPYDITHRIVHPDGSVRWVQERGEHFYDAQGAPLRTLGAVQDITARVALEGETRQIRDRLQFIIDASPDWIFAKDLQHRFVLVNKAFATAQGLSPAHMIGRSDTEFWSQELCEGNPDRGIRGFHEDDRRAFAGELCQNSRDPATFGDGSLHLFDTLKGPLRDTTGAIIGVFSYSRDITQRVEAEERYRSVVATMAEGVVVQQADGQIVANNAAAEEILGLTADQMRGRTAIDERWRAVRSDGTEFPGDQHPGTVALRTGRSSNNVIMGVDHPAKTERRWISINAHPLTLPGAAQPYGSVASFADITERKRAEDAILASNQLLAAVLDTTPVLIAHLDATMNFVRVNAAYAAADQKTPDYFVGKNHFAIYPNAENEAIFRRVLATGVSHAVEAKAFQYQYNPERGLSYWDWTVTPLKDSSERVAGLVISLLNVTDRIKALEDVRRSERELHALTETLEARVATRTRELSLAKEVAEQASLAKTEFLSRMSHELRTPLNAILGFAQVLELEAMPPEQQEFVHEIHRAGDHLLALINEVLDLARIESGRLDVHLEAVALTPLIQACGAQIRPLAEHRRITLALGSSANYAVQADKMRLKEVLLNLLSNAVKYNHEGGSIQVNCTAAGPQRVRISVQDTGRGIAVGALPRLFKTFERIESAYDGIEGTGIGLALTKTLVEAMHGMIGVDTVVGDGSTFWVELPAATAHLAAAVPAAERPVVVAHYHQRRAMLYIEDNPANLRLVKKIVASRAHIELCEAASAEAGLEVAAQRHFDLILLDINLPGMNGFEALQRLREHPASRGVPVVAVTSNAMARDIARGKAAGFADYITKPLDVAQFMTMLDHHLAECVEPGS